MELKELFDLFANGVLYTGLTGLLILVSIGVFTLLKDSWEIIKRGRHLIAVIPLMLISIWLGGTKPASQKITIFFDAGLHDNGSRVDTNDFRLVHFKWRYDENIPKYSRVKGWAFPYTPSSASGVLTEDDMIPIFNDVPITDLGADVLMISDATNFVYYLEHSYIPDAPVVTNGVYHIHAVGTNNVWVPIGLTIKEDSRIISPRKE